MKDKIYTITELTKEIKTLLEGSFIKIWVEGEISNYTRHSSGHRYFTLKDQGAQIRCVIWRWIGEHIFFEPQDGMKVKASGQVTVYEKSGQYQLTVSSMQPAGIGELEMAFQQLKKKLAEEGLFDAEHKKPIPEFPNRIGIVTSPTGATIRDILNITRRRAPWIEIIIWPVAVQGEGAAKQIANAIRGFNKHQLVDVLIIGRGGGSLEDLWAFNEEVVAREIYDSKIPVISAVGHEVDFTIADFVADLRAPTPSTAAELAVPDIADLSTAIQDYRDRLTNAIVDIISFSKDKLTEFSGRYGLKKPLEIIARRSQRHDELHHLLNLNFAHSLEKYKDKTRSTIEKLEIVSPKGIMKRGYSYCRDFRGTAVKSFKQVAVDDKINISLYEGGLLSTVTRIEPPEN